MNILYDKHLEAIKDEVYVGKLGGDYFVSNVDTAALKCYEITESIACEFAEWMLHTGSDIKIRNKDLYTTKKLFKLFIESKTN